MPPGGGVLMPGITNVLRGRVRIAAAAALLAAVLSAALLWTSAIAGASQGGRVFRPQPANQVAFHDQMRKLWEDHITWTRLAIIGAVDELPDTALTVDRLLRNQDDIGAAIVPFYGQAAGGQLTVLLAEPH